MESQRPHKAGSSPGKLQRLGRKRDPRSDSEEELENDLTSVSGSADSKRGRIGMV